MLYNRCQTGINVRTEIQEQRTRNFRNMLNNIIYSTYITQSMGLFKLVGPFVEVIENIVLRYKENVDFLSYTLL